MTIHREENNGEGAFYYESEGRRLAEMAYRMHDGETMVIDHTDVDDSLRGQGVGKKLLGKLVDYVRANGIKVVPLCPFANATFQKTPEWQDVLANLQVSNKPG